MSKVKIYLLCAKPEISKNCFSGSAVSRHHHKNGQTVSFLAAIQQNEVNISLKLVKSGGKGSGM